MRALEARREHGAVRKVDVSHEGGSLGGAIGALIARVLSQLQVNALVMLLQVVPSVEALWALGAFVLPLDGVDCFNVNVETASLKEIFFTKLTLVFFEVLMFVFVNLLVDGPAKLLAAFLAGEL